ncbi:MAG: type II secretion system protein GspK [Desulfotignum sp.]
MSKILCNDRGVALVVTIAIVGILVTAGMQLGKITGDAVLVTMVEKDRFQARQLAVSGIELARVILAEDAAMNTTDSVQEVWADPDKLTEVVRMLGLESDDLSIKITDELSKIQVNALISQFPGNQINPDQAGVWENFFRPFFSGDKSLDDRDPDMIINSVKDWIDDKDDGAISGLSGAESDYYQGLEPPYACANGPFNHLEELLSVRGISKDLLEMGQTEVNVPGMELGDENRDADQQSITLSDVFTVYGLDDRSMQDSGFRYPGQININTADRAVLAAILPEGMEELARELIDFREQKTDDGEMFVNQLGKGWYKNIIGLPPKEQQRMDRLVRYASDTFKIESTAWKNSASVTLLAFVKREKDAASGRWQCRILRMERQ